MAARKATRRTRTNSARTAGVRKPARRQGGTRKSGGRRGARTSGASQRIAPPPLRAMSELTDEERLRAFAAVQQTLRAHGIGNTLAELHFASDELALVCGPGEVRRVVAFRCGPGVCTKNVCVPLTEALP